MRRLRFFFALVLATLWLPATQHCALEAAGWAAQTCSAACEQDSTDSKDSCSTVEDGAYKASAGSLKASAPALLVCVDSLDLFIVQFPAACVPAISPSESFVRPRDWVLTWHFARRAAPSPRAPSVSLA